MEVRVFKGSALLDIKFAPSALVGIVTMIALLPVPGYLSKLTQDVQTKKMEKVALCFFLYVPALICCPVRSTNTSSHGVWVHLSATLYHDAN